MDLLFRPSHPLQQTVGQANGVESVLDNGTTNE
jgi:hypothetical protein